MGESEKKSRRPHALGIALPVQGHINPMMHLARKLASRGCIVTLVNLESNHKKLLPVENQVSADLDIRFESIPDRVSVPVGSLDIFSSVENRAIFREAYEAMEDDLVDLLQSKLLKSNSDAITFIIGDVYLPWIARVGDKFGLPKVVFSTTCASSVLVDYYIPRLIKAGEIPVKAGNLDKPVQSSLPGLPSPLVQADLPTYFVEDLKRSEASFERRHDKVKLLAGCDWILVNSCDVLEGEAFRSLQSQVNKNFIGVGPLLEETAGTGKQTEAAWKTDRGCLNWLDTRSPNSVLYISFGSLATMPPQQFLELAAGLKQSRHSFLWVVRPNLLVAEDESSKKAVKSAWEIIKELRGGEKRLCTVEWAPQLEVLAHASVGGFLTHCGWNSVLEALWYGVPMLGWPQLVEQNLVCRIMCGEWKTGLSLNRSGGMVGRDDIAGCINRLMTAGGIRENCLEFQKSVRQAPGVHLDAFIQSFE